MKASCNDSWRGWIEIVTPAGTKKCTYNGHSWYFVDGDTDSHYGSYFKEGTGVTNGRTITLNCGGSTSRIDQKNPPQTSSSYQNRPPLPLIPKPSWLVKPTVSKSDYRVGFKTSVVNQASSTCTPEVVIYFQDSWIRPIRFTGLDITRNGGSITYSNYVKSPNSAIDKVTMKASCNDSWRGWIEIVTPAGTKKCTYNGHSWYFVDGDTDSHYGSYFKKGTGATNGEEVALDCRGSTSRIGQKNPPQTSSSYQNRPSTSKPTASKSDYRVGFKTSVVNQASSTCTPEVSIYFNHESIDPIKFTGLDITRKGGSTTYTNFVKRPNSSIGKVTMKASCNDSWRGWIEIVTPTGTRKCTYNGNSWYFVDGDTDSHYGSYFKKGTGVTNGRTITLNC